MSSDTPEPRDAETRPASAGQDARRLLEQGRAQLARGEREDAFRTFIEAIERDPSFEPVYQTLRNLRLDDSELNETALSTYRAITEQHPELPFGHINLGDALSKTGRPREAIPAYRAAIRLKTKTSRPSFVEHHWDAEAAPEPGFIIIGAEKSGTSSLYHYLCQHPAVLAPLEKEIHYFSQKAPNGAEWYRSHFPPVPSGCGFITGEASTSYLHTRRTAERIADLLPKAKLLAILRHPVDRAYSQYQQRCRLGLEARSFDETVSDELACIEKARDPLTAGRSLYLRLGLYQRHLEPYRQRFPPEQLLVLGTRQLDERPEAIMDQVHGYLALPPHQLTSYTRYNAASYSPMGDELRIRLSEFFRPFNARLEQELGRSFDWD